ncbi:unnamed protein product [Caenorhabditis sp. 36 PRJEB53466]|nr:unnamed protein product [Caenorhabditis sp. 36 PRJEB53466]
MFHHENHPLSTEVRFHYGVSTESRVMDLVNNDKLISELREEFKKAFGIIIASEFIDLRTTSYGDPVTCSAVFWNGISEWPSTHLDVFVSIRDAVIYNGHAYPTRTEAMIDEELRREKAQEAQFRIMKDTQIAEEQLEIREMIEAQKKEMEAMKTEMEKMKMEIKDQAEKLMKNTHSDAHDANCDGCRQHIRGHRFMCSVCHDYDLCATCEAKGTHPEHTMYRIVRPAGIADADAPWWLKKEAAAAAVKLDVMKQNDDDEVDDLEMFDDEEVLAALRGEGEPEEEEEEEEELHTAVAPTPEPQEEEYETEW